MNAKKVSNAEKVDKKKSISKKSKEPPPPEPEDEEEETGMTEADQERMRRGKVRKNKKAKMVGYRTLAKESGYLGLEDGAVVGSMDSAHALLSASDAKRLMRFVPCTPGAISYDAAEFEKRHSIMQKGVPSSVARETQARADAVLRHVMNEAVLRAAEAGKSGVQASHVLSVLRPFKDRMLFSSLEVPVGLVRHAQDQGVLSATEKDVAERAEEKKVATSTNKKMHEEWLKAEVERKEARRAAKLAKKEASPAVVAVA